MSLRHHRELLDLLGHQRTGCLLRLKDLQTFPSLQPPLGHRCLSPSGKANWGPEHEAPLGVTLIAPGRRTHPLCSCRQNTFTLTYSVLARAAGMAPVLFDVSRQVPGCLLHVSLEVCEPDTRRSRDASQSSTNLLPWLQEENVLSQPCRLLQPWDT